MRGLAPGGVGPGWAGGAVEGGEVFYGGGEWSHVFTECDEIVSVERQLYKSTKHLKVNPDPVVSPRSLSGRVGKIGTVTDIQQKNPVITGFFCVRGL